MTQQADNWNEKKPENAKKVTVTDIDTTTQALCAERQTYNFGSSSLFLWFSLTCYLPFAARISKKFLISLLKKKLIGDLLCAHDDCREIWKKTKQLQSFSMILTKFAFQFQHFICFVIQLVFAHTYQRISFGFLI